MTPERIQKIRHGLGETTAEFAKHFHRSERTIEDWEQGRRKPDKLVVSIMQELSRKIRSRTP